MAVFFGCKQNRINDNLFFVRWSSGHGASICVSFISLLVHVAVRSWLLFSAFPKNLHFCCGLGTREPLSRAPCPWSFLAGPSKVKWKGASVWRRRATELNLILLMSFACFISSWAHVATAAEKPGNRATLPLGKNPFTELCVRVGSGFYWRRAGLRWQSGLGSEFR